MKKPQKFSLWGLLIILTTIFFYYCSSPTEPWVKDPRDYTWTVDTIKNEAPGVLQTMMESVWASSPNDVYICGHTDAGRNIYHYDGDKWAPINLRDHGLRNGNRNKVFGFAENDVWIAGALKYNAEGGYKTSELIHYNGANWESYEFETRSELFDVWGSSPNDIWACGFGGIIIHYNGHYWEIDTLNVDFLNEGEQFFPYSIREYNNIPYVVGYRYPNPYYLFKKNNENWGVVDSVVSGIDEYYFGTSGLFVSKSNDFYSYGPEGFFKYNQGNWEKILNVSSMVGNVAEFARNRFLVSEFRNNLYLLENGHYEVIKQTEADDIHFVNVWGNNEECFVLCWDYNSNWGGTLVYHGK